MTCKSERPLSGLETYLDAPRERARFELAKVNDRLAVWRQGSVHDLMIFRLLAKVNDRLAVWRHCRNFCDGVHLFLQK